MDEKKRKDALTLLKFGLVIAGIGDIVFAVLAYLGGSYTMMGFIACEGLSKIVLGLALPLLLKKDEALIEAPREEGEI